MADQYSTYEAKAKLSEILRKVRAGRRVIISYHGDAIAEIRPIGKSPDSLQTRLEELEREGVLASPKQPPSALKPLKRKRGALKRFLEERE